MIPPWSTETEALEKTPLLESERSRHGKNSVRCYIPEGVRHPSHSPNPSMNSQFESGPSCPRSPIYKRSLSSETLLSSSSDKESESSERTSLDSLNLQCIYPQQSQPLLSNSGLLCNMWNWVELRLENSGSVARDHLASERTFLAYMRTSLGLASYGTGESPLFSSGSTLRADHTIFYVAIVFSTATESAWQDLHVYIRSLGASTVILGLLVLFMGLSSSPCETTLFSFIFFTFFSGFSRYFTIQVALTKGVFPVARFATGFVAMMLGVSVILTFGILLAGKLEKKWKASISTLLSMRLSL